MIDVALLPSHINPATLATSQVVVLDVLRATSTIVTALANRAKEVLLFPTLDAARAAKAGFGVHASACLLLAGESHCLKPADFDLGNSPAEYPVHKVANATILLATTNGTVAATAVQSAPAIFIASLLNSAATAQALLPNLHKMSTLLVCSGTNGQIAQEDLLGAGSILFQLMQQTYNPTLPFTDTAWIAYHAFAAAKARLPAALRLGAGGINLIEAGLEDDIDLCAQLDSLPIVVQLHPNPLRATKEQVA